MTNDRPALRLERHLSHPPERVFRAVTDPAELERWFVAPVPWKPELGETFETFGATGEITELEEPRVLAWTWGRERYRFEITPEGDGGSVLVFTHVYDPSLGPGEQHEAGWQAYFARLDAHLDGGYLSEEEAHGALLEDGPSLRLVRTLQHSPERVWRAITEPDELAHWFPSGEPLEVTESDPPRLLAGTWWGDPIRIELEPAGDSGDATLLTFIQGFDDRDTAARTAAGWDRCLLRLRALLDGEPLGERESLAEWPQVHELYAARFGVDPELGRRAFADHPLT